MIESDGETIADTLKLIAVLDYPDDESLGAGIR
jgi:hypothetical protein